MLTAVVAFLLGSLAVARATRLVTADAYPPAEALRRWWFNQTIAKGGWREGWAPLLTDKDGGHGCPFCAAPYAAAVNLTWAYLAGVATGGTGGWVTAWWLVNLWAAGSYLASMVVVRDEPPAEDA